VTHADPIRLLLVHFAGAHTDTFMRLMVEPASVSAVALSDGAGPRILRVNDTGSLAGLAGLAGLAPPARRRPKLRG